MDAVYQILDSDFFWEGRKEKKKKKKLEMSYISCAI